MINALSDSAVLDKENTVSHYTIEELIARWKKEDLSVEQVIGQLLLLVHEQQQLLRELARRPCEPPDAPGVVRRAR